MKLRQISYNNGTPINESDIFSSIYGQLPFELVFRVLKKPTHPIAQTTFFDGLVLLYLITITKTLKKFQNTKYRNL